ncbi:MAG: acyltransferase [Haliea sp.]|nr:MAG: acyltransferase [Haliea sp.]
MSGTGTTGGAPGKLQWIQSLRGIAALMVLFFHMTPHWATVPALAVFTGAMQWGFAGVDVFFALSGFVVYQAAKKAVRQGVIARFVQHRLLRVYLGYWPVLCLLALTNAWVLNRPFPPAEKALFSILLFYPSMWDNWLLPAWSLTFELCFYAWVLVLILAWRSRPQVMVALALAFLLVWNVGWILLQPGVVYGGQQPLRYALSPFGIEFFMGALASEVFERTRTPAGRARVALLLVGGTMVAGGFALGTTTPAFTNVDILRVASFGAAGLGLLLLFLALELGRLAPPRWLVVVGNASYSLYLLHTILLDLFAALRSLIERYIGWSAAPLLLVIVMPVVIVLLAVLWYRKVERPLLELALRRGARPARRIPAGESS